MNTDTYKYEISIIILTYNSSIEKVKQTIESSIQQKNVDLEIIVADDGSVKNNVQEIRNIFKEFGFNDYKLVMNPSNKGTVSNLLSGLRVSEGKYSKGIGPGDKFVNSNVCRKWIDFMDLKGCNWSFSEAKYYTLRDGKEILIREKAHPQLIRPYLKNKKDICRWNYLVLQDIALGASTIYFTHIIKKYLEILRDCGVKYAEDNVWRLLMFIGDVGCYFPEVTILYEFGAGISTSGNDKWEKRLKMDWECTDKCIFEEQNIDMFQRRIQYAMMKKKGLIQRLFIKGRFIFIVRTKLFMRKTMF